MTKYTYFWRKHFSDFVYLFIHSIPFFYYPNFFQLSKTLCLWIFLSANSKVLFVWNSRRFLWPRSLVCLPLISWRLLLRVVSLRMHKNGQESSIEGDGVVILVGLFLDLERLLFLLVVVLHVLFLPVVLLFTPLELCVLLFVGEGMDRKLLTIVD